MAAETQKVDEVPRYPVGTLEELQRDGFDPAVYRSCARPVKDTVGPGMLVVGCDKFDKCNLSCKGKSGPRNYGVEIIKGPALGGHVLRRTLSCIGVAEMADFHEQNDGVINIIADEGETYTNVEIRRSKNEQGLPEQREMDVEVKVPAHPRPNQNPDLVRDRVKALARKRELELKRNERTPEALGISGTRLPLDSPQRRGPGRPPKDAGGQSGAQ